MAKENISVEQLYSKTGSIYKLVVLAARRALELNEGAAKLVDAETDKNALLALQEIAEAKVSYKAKPGE